MYKKIAVALFFLGGCAASPLTSPDDAPAPVEVEKADLPPIQDCIEQGAASQKIRCWHFCCPYTITDPMESVKDDACGWSICTTGDTTCSCSTDPK